MKGFRKLIILVLFITLVSCTSPNKLMDSWTGQNISELYSSWGPPSCTTSDGKGGTIVSYYYDKNFELIQGIAEKKDDGSISYTMPEYMSYSAARHFYADSNGIIYSWFYKGI